MIHEVRSIAAEGDAIDLDPFGFWPDIRSRLVGLGGDQDGDNPDYAFHTLYIACGVGPILFTARFTGLQAPRGTLILRIHELPEAMGAHAQQVAMAQAQLVDLTRGDGSVSLAATARNGCHYALLGYIYGDTIARADDVEVEIAKRMPPPDSPDQATRYRAEAARIDRTARIVGDREGTLITPVSQLCTKRQVGEPIFAAVLDQLEEMPGASPISLWEQVFLARVMDRYDIARSGARGLGIEGVGSPLTRWLVEHGCSLVMTTRREVADEPDLSHNVHIHKLGSDTFDDLTGFDFAWTTRAEVGLARGRQDVLGFVEECLRTLKPGGLFAFTVPMDVSPRAIGDDRGRFVRRPEIDRIVLVLLSRGHQIAQIRPWGDPVIEADSENPEALSAFGLIVRKG